MANSKKRCTFCKDYYLAESMLKTPRGYFCCAGHALEYARKKAHVKQKAEFYENDTKTRKREAIKAFNSFIRARDAGKRCISCNKPIQSNDYAAGHFITAGSSSLLQFDESNVNGQCNKYCNSSLSGNVRLYRIGLVARVGEREVQRLENTKGTIKRTAQDYKKIEVEYKAKLKEMESNQEAAA